MFTIEKITQHRQLHTQPNDLQNRVYYTHDQSLDDV